MTRPAPSAALLDRLARRFAQSPGHAAWRARHGVGQAQELGRPSDNGIARVPDRGLHAGEGLNSIIARQTPAAYPFVASWLTDL